MKGKSTKSALLMSFTSLLLCFAMLIGSTFAWFTDSVTSGVNQIKAGNLDIEVSYKDGDTWKSIQDVGTLFNPNALWEPGHTEYVNLKIENKGNLALKYQMKVSPVSESGGINVLGNSFKLSDYLVFGTAEATEAGYADRAAARAAVSTTMKLNQAGLSKSSTMAKDAPAQYVTLVVYMPETVGNEANYKTGTAAPFINLGITVLATQVENEKDSFDQNYDAGLTNDATVVYNYFPQVNVTAQLVIDGDNKVVAGSEAGGNVTVTPLQNDSAKSKVVMSSTEQIENTAAAKVETILQKDGDSRTGSMTLKVVKDDTENANFKTDSTKINTATQDSTTYKVTVETEGVVAVPETEGKANFKVDLFIGKSRTNVKMYHSGTKMTTDNAGANNTFTYDDTTGYVTMFVNSFSPFTAVYDMPVAAIGTTVYYTLESAIAAVENSETVTLLKSCAGNGIKVPSDKNFTIDFNGFTYNIDGTTVGSTGTETNGFQLLKNSTITFKNGKLTSSKAKILIQNYCNLTLENMTLDGMNLVDDKYAASNNNGTVMIKNTTINAASDGVAFDVYSFSSYTGANVTVENSTINGKVEVGASNGADISNLKLTIESGTINGNIVVDDIAARKAGVVSITGGTFSVKPEDTYLAADHIAVENNGVWNVVYQEPKEISITDTEGTTEMSFDSFRTNVNGGNTYANATVKLMKNITIDDGMPVVGQFAGTFDGDNKTITMTAQICMNDMSKGYCFEDGKKYAFGIFDRVSGTIKNVNVVYSDTTPVAVSTHYTYLGGIVGFLGGGTIDNCTVRGTIRNYNRIGGFVGAGYTGNVKNCVMTANITDLNFDAYTYQLAGGIVGFLGKSETINFTIEGCTVKGCYLGFDLSSGTPEQCNGYAAGGILGWAETDNKENPSSLAIKNCTLTNVKGDGHGYGNQVGVYYCGGTSTLTLTGLTINGVSVPDDSYTYSSGEGGSLWTSPFADGSFGTTRLMQITAGCQPNHSAAN